MCSDEDDEDDEFFSLLVEEATEFCGYIGELLQSVHTSGVWSNGLAVHDIYMMEFGEREGAHSVQQHMRGLDIDQTETEKPLLSLALQMVVNNRCEGCMTAF